jgi:predicted TIM-barrel fold metal-dependent hydrolase
VSIGGDILRPGRRAVLAAGAALGVVTLWPVYAQSYPRRINVHSHHAPPAWASAIKGTPDDAPPNQRWTVEQTLEDMEKAGIALSINSVTRPGVAFLPTESAARVSSESNEYSTALAERYKGKFGNFATLPMPAVDETLEEIAYALDVLQMEGICLMTSYGDKWLGDVAFTPVMEELNRRKVVAFVHPTASICCGVSVPEVGPSLFEFNTDTTRAVASLIFTRTAERFSDISFIFCHGGGTVPMLLDRFRRPSLTNREQKFTPESVMTILRHFHYDTAIATNESAMSALKAMVPITQILLGTDFPFRQSPEQTEALQTLLSKDELLQVERGNALRLMPSLA